MHAQRMQDGATAVVVSRACYRERGRSDQWSLGALRSSGDTHLQEPRPCFARSAAGVSYSRRIEMKRHVRIGAATIGAAFVLVTMYDVTVHGLLEPTSLFPSHFTAGAGSLSFLARFWLLVAVLITAPFALWNRARRAASLFNLERRWIGGVAIFHLVGVRDSTTGTAV